ncbi:MAG: rhodanese-like domain-containing protein [bacterium]
MKRFVVLLVALGCFGAATVAAPIFSVDNPVYSVTLQSNSLVSHTFVLRNVGDETLTITDVVTSCGCTTAALAERELAPEESVDLQATVNTTGFRGTVTRTVSVTSNDPANPVAVFQIVVTIAESTAPVIQEISVGDLKLVFYFLIDVRTSEEYAAGHLFGAMNIPLAEFQQDLDSWLPRLPREVPIILYCLAGGRSLQAATILVEAGLTNVLNLTGGITEWNRVNGESYLFAL